MKGKISVITPKQWTSPDNVVKKFWEFQIEGDDKVYACWQQTFASMKVGDEADFDATQDARNNWKATFKQGGGGKSWGKSPEEIALQKKAFALAYAKDQVNQMIASTAPLYFKELPEGAKYSDFFEKLRQVSVQATLKTATDMAGFLNA